MKDDIKNYVIVDKLRNIVTKLLKENKIPLTEEIVENIVDYTLNLQKELSKYPKHEDQLQYLMKIIICNAAVLLNQPKSED